jgi:NAD(P)-dependent dehydrogenase (short-subunit alcohol dehydrogenase family)
MREKEMTMRLADKRVLVTGGSSGIGRAIVERFVAEGARVVFCGRSAERGNAIAAELGADAEFIQADTTSAEDIERLIAAAVADGPIDCLINNAAASESGTLADLTPELLEECMWSVFGSVVLATKAIVPHMRAAGGGTIINIGSTAAHRGNSSPPVYSSLKAAVCHLSRCLALELSADRIRVNTISPGAVMTPIFQENMGLSALSRVDALPIISEALAAVSPVGRGGVPADIASAAVFLASMKAPTSTVTTWLSTVASPRATRPSERPPSARRSGRSSDVASAARTPWRQSDEYLGYPRTRPPPGVRNRRRHQGGRHRDLVRRVDRCGEAHCRWAPGSGLRPR